MDFIRIVPLFLLAVVLVSAGCTQNNSTQTTATQLPVTTPQPTLSTLALGAGDIPQNFSLIESREKNVNEVGDLAHQLGWQDGYVVQFSDGRQGRQETSITQSIAVYPARNIPSVIFGIRANDTMGTYLNYTNISVPDNAPGTGFYGKASTNAVVVPTNSNPLVSGPTNHDVQVVYPIDTAEILFAKGEILEILRMSGPGTDPAVLEKIASAAYAKLP